MSPKPAFVSSARRYLLKMQRRHAMPVVVLPPLATVGLVVFDWHPSPFRLALFAFFYVVSVLGVTVGYHRMLTHGAFTCAPWARALLTAMGCLAAEGPPTFWVANHRMHHQFSDAEGDPHSPLRDTETVASRLASFVHAHVGWMFTELPADPLRYAPDLVRDRALGRMNKAYVWLVLGGLLVPALLGTAVLGGWRGFVDGLLWGGFVRLFAAQHVTWCINSVCHVLGSRPYDTKDGSRNSFLFGVLALGEGWHNNHHADPTSAAHGFLWWQFDASYTFIRLLEWLRIARNVRGLAYRRLARLSDEPPPSLET